jgi:hypothetical protein
MAGPEVYPKRSGARFVSPANAFDGDDDLVIDLGLISEQLQVLAQQVVGAKQTVATLD